MCVGIEQREKEAFAIFVFAAKLITCTALLALIAVIEFGLVVKIFNAEFGKHEPPLPTCIHRPEAQPARTDPKSSDQSR